MHRNYIAILVFCKIDHFFFQSPVLTRPSTRLASQPVISAVRLLERLSGYGFIVVVSALGAFQAGVQRTTAFHARYVVTFPRFVTALWRITARVENWQSLHHVLLKYGLTRHKTKLQFHERVPFIGFIL